ncbi:unnamed protein product [Caretta caretta]
MHSSTPSPTRPLWSAVSETGPDMSQASDPPPQEQAAPSAAGCGKAAAAAALTPLLLLLLGAETAAARAGPGATAARAPQSVKNGSGQPRTYTATAAKCSEGVWFPV